jgi:hypothetical protein
VQAVVAVAVILLVVAQEDRGAVAQGVALVVVEQQARPTQVAAVVVALQVVTPVLAAQAAPVL